MENTTTPPKITLYLPQAIYRQIQQKAEAQQRSVEEVLEEAIAMAFPLADASPELLEKDGRWMVQAESLPKMANSATKPQA